ncbi:MAG: hypothetical protein IPK66_10200 [Rhodospirillales bacterium]|nr:hypothetical protein [Rhodospirillales bacterium]
MSEADEYVETRVMDGFRRESEQEENIVRTLPFFATSLGIIATVISLARPAICDPSWHPFVILTYALLAALAFSVVAVFWNLFKSVSSRHLIYPMSEQDLLDYAGRLRAYYTVADAAPAAIEDAIVGDLREAFTRQLAEAAEWNHARNVPRLRARSRALTALIAAVALAFAILAVIFFTQTMEPGGCHADNGRNGYTVAPANAPA